MLRGGGRSRLGGSFVWQMALQAAMVAVLRNVEDAEANGMQLLLEAAVVEPERFCLGQKFSRISNMYLESRRGQVGARAQVTGAVLWLERYPPFYSTYVFTFSKDLMYIL